MIKHYRQFVKLLGTQVKQYRILDNAKKIVENTTEKAQSKVSNAQSIASESYNIITQRLNNQAVIIQDLNAKALQLDAPLPKRIVKWWQWYNQLTGLNTVEAAKEHVTILQDKLFRCKDNRRALNKEFIDITFKLQEISSQISRTKRDDPQYVNLTIIEHEYSQEQKKIKDQLSLFEKEESDNFTQLATAIKEYHDNQNLNSQKYKYLSILMSAIIAIISLGGSMILNNQRILDVRNTIKAAQKKNELSSQININELSDIKKILHSFETKFSQLAQINKETANKSDSSSNIIMTSAKYSAQLLITGASYVKRGIYACVSYIFYK